MWQEKWKSQICGRREDNSQFFLFPHEGCGKIVGPQKWRDPIMSKKMIGFTISKWCLPYMCSSHLLNTCESQSPQGQYHEVVTHFG